MLCSIQHLPSFDRVHARMQLLHAVACRDAYLERVNDGSKRVSTVYPANLARPLHSHPCNGHSIVIAAKITIQLKAGRSSLAYVSQEIEHARLVHPLFPPSPTHATPIHVSLLFFSLSLCRYTSAGKLLLASSFVASNTREQGSSSS